MALTKVKLIADGTIVQSNLHASHGITTADIGEGSNLYYTDARARAAVSVSGNALSYDSSTGVITSNFEESPTFTGNVVIDGTTNSGRLFVEQSGADMIDMTRTSVGTYRLAISTSDKFSIYDVGATSDRFVIDSSGNVGIGTTSPLNKFDLRGTAYVTGYTVGFDTSPQGNYAYRLTNDGGNSFINVQGGNLGINTSSPSYKLEVNGGTALVGGGFYVSSDQSIVTSSTYTFRDGVYINNPNSSSAATTSNSVMSIGASTGNSVNTSLITTGAVGIGTTSPIRKLHVEEATTWLGRFAYNANNYVDIRYDGFNIAGGDMVFQNAGSEKMRIKSTPTPQIRIADGDNEQLAAIRLGGENAGGGRLYFEYNGDNSYIDSYGGHGSTQRYRDLTIGARNLKLLTGNTSGGTRMYIDVNGNVGIGHTLPTSKLSIVGDGGLNTYAGVIGIENTDGDPWACISLTDDIDTASAASNYYLIGRGLSYASRQMSFHVPTASDYGSGAQPQFVFASTGADILMSINASTGLTYHKGSVGIGITSPTKTLDVRTDNGVLIKGASGTTNASLSFLPASGGRQYDLKNSGSSFVIHDASAGTDRMYFHYNGGLGIGTTSPSEILHINKNATSRVVGAYFTNSQANTGAEAVSIAFGLNRSGGDFVRQVEAIEFGAEQQWTGTPSTVNSYLAFNVVKSETAYERMRVTTNGVDVTSYGAHGVHLKPDTNDSNNSGRLFLTRVGGAGWAIMNNSTNFSIRSNAQVNTTSGTEKIRLTGYSATSWTSGSDETMKENIIPIGNVLDKIQNYRCVEYNFIDDETADKKIGFIAQDWQEDFPQIIEQMENEKIGMKYTETIPILLKAIQEQQEIINDLKNRIQTLENN